MIKSYIKTAWRGILRSKTTSFINLIGLTIGMTASLFIFLWVRNELSYDSYHPDAENIYRIKSYISVSKSDTWVWETSPYLLGEAIKDELPEVQLVTRISHLSPVIRANDELFSEKNVACVDEHWFDMFHYDFIRGNAAAFNNGIHQVVLTESSAKKYFGNTDPIGKTLYIDTADFMVQGVVKDYPANSSFRYDLFLPQAARRVNPSTVTNDNQWGNFNFRTFVKIAPPANAKSVAKGIDHIMNTHREENKNKVGLISIKDMHFEDDLQSSSTLHGNRKMVHVFTALGILLLMIACINYVNLTTAKALQRIKEVSIKKIVGAGRGSLFFQFVVESTLFSLLTILLALILAKSLLPLFNDLTDNRFELSLASPNIWNLIGITLFISILLTSIYPAFLLSSFRPLAIFKGTNALQLKDSYLRKALVVLQFTFSIVLIIGTIVVYSQMRFITSENDTYDKSQVLSFTIPYRAMAKLDAEARNVRLHGIKQELLAHNDISRVSMTNGSVINMQSYSSGGSDWDGREEGVDPAITFFEADDDFNQILNLQLAAGRWFLPNSKADEKNAILNETAVKELGIREPVIGQRFVSRGDSGIVIGVVKDFYYKSLHEKINPVVIKNIGYEYTFLVQTMPGKSAESQRIAERIWKSHFPDAPFTYTFLNDAFDRLYKADRRSITLIWIFALLTVTVSTLGLYGLATFSAESRTKEIGIRKVLGASVSGIIGLLSKDFVKLVLIAIVIASPLAWWAMNKWLEDFAYRIEITWWMFALAGSMAIVVAIFTVATQAIKAALANPVESLRDE